MKKTAFLICSTLLLATACDQLGQLVIEPVDTPDAGGTVAGDTATPEDTATAPRPDAATMPDTVVPDSTTAPDATLPDSSIAPDSSTDAAPVAEHPDLHVQYAMKTIPTGPSEIGYGFLNLMENAARTESTGRVDNLNGWGLRDYYDRMGWLDVLEVRSTRQGETYGDAFDDSRHPKGRCIRLKVFGGPALDGTSKVARYHDDWHFAPGDWLKPAGGPSGLEGYVGNRDSGGVEGKTRVDIAARLGGRQNHMAVKWGRRYLVGYSVKFPHVPDGFTFDKQVSWNWLSLNELQNAKVGPNNNDVPGFALSLAQDRFKYSSKRFDAAGNELKSVDHYHPAAYDVWFDIVFDFHLDGAKSHQAIWIKRADETQYTLIDDFTGRTIGDYSPDFDLDWHFDLALYAYSFNWTNLSSGDRKWVHPYRILSLLFAEFRMIEIARDGSDFDEGWRAIDPSVNRWR